MSEEKLLTIREVALILNITEKEVIELAENQVVPAYRIGGVYLRFKHQQIEEYKRKIKPLVSQNNPSKGNSFKDKIIDFIYFNDFYILSVLIVAVIVIILFKGY